MKELKILLLDLLTEKKWRRYLLFFLTAPILSFIFFDVANSKEEKETSQNLTDKPVPFDTLIPAGFTLLPIEVANIDTINSFVGQFAITDVYTQSLNHALTGNLVAENVKLLRSQVDSRQMALIIPQFAIAHFMKHAQPYALVIHQQNQNLEFRLPKPVSRTNLPEVTYFE